MVMTHDRKDGPEVLEFRARTRGFMSLFEAAPPAKKEAFARAHVRLSGDFQAIAEKGAAVELLANAAVRIDVVMRRAVRIHTDGGGAVSCRRRCNHCCHLDVVATHEEVAAAMKAAKKARHVVDIERLKLQADASRDATWQGLSREQAACVFLTKAGDCAVYDARPLVCRKYLAASAPERCDTFAAYGDRVTVVANDEAELVTSALFDALPHGPLSAGVLAYLSRFGPV